MNGYNYEEKRKENQAIINAGTNRMLNSGRATIKKSLDKTLSEYNNRLKKIPELYQNMKNNLTNSNNKEIKRMNENIANTGNHTAGGYAISQRLNNINSFNKAQSEIDLNKQKEISDIKTKISDAKSEADSKLASLEAGIYEKNLNMLLDENNRTMDFNLELDKLSETKRLNDVSIEKTKNDIILANNDDARKTEKHTLEMEYLPQKYEGEIEGINANNLLIGEKILSEQASRNSKGTSGGLAKSGSSGSGEKDTPLSKLSSKDIAERIKNLAGKKSYDSYGNVEYKISEQKAFIYLMEWKNKYKLPDYIVNDVSILLGIQDYL